MRPLVRPEPQARRHGLTDMKIMGTAPAADMAVMPTSAPGDVGHTPWSQRVRSLLLGPHGGGTTRRRASDAVRVGIAAVLLVICIPLVQANTSVEIHVTELVTPPPSGIHWLITAIWFVGSIGVIVGPDPHRPAGAAAHGRAADGRWPALAALLVCLLLDALLGPAAGRPPIPEFAGFDPRFPIIQLAIATAVALAGLPYLSRPDAPHCDRRHRAGRRSARSSAPTACRSASSPR